MPLYVCMHVCVYVCMCTIPNGIVQPPPEDDPFDPYVCMYVCNWCVYVDVSENWEF
jgi:hypothetical protein